MGLYIWDMVNSFCLCVCGGGGGELDGSDTEKSSKREIFRLFIFHIVPPIFQQN